MAYNRKRRAHFIVGDINGKRAKTGIWMNMAGAPGPTLDESLTAAELTATKIRDCSTGGMEDVTLSSHSVDPAFSAEASSAEGYQNAEDKATLIFRAADGAQVALSVPAPKETVFKDDDKTVDPLDAAIAALITNVLATAVTYGGAALIEFVKGYRKRAKNQ